MNLPLLLRTLRHLRAGQIIYRPLRVAQFKAYRSFPKLASKWQRSPAAEVSESADTINIFRNAVVNQFPHISKVPFDGNAFASGSFSFLNKEVILAEPDWNNRYESHLWNYQLHYFDFALPAALAIVREGAEPVKRRFEFLIDSWINSAKIGESDGWDAYPVSLRAVNWIYAYAVLADCPLDEAFRQKWLASIFQQLSFLRHHLEFHLLANHLLKNAKALVVGGLFFKGLDLGEEWLDFGTRFFLREFDEQILADGGHYERSPMYHAICAADFVEGFGLLKAFGRAGISTDQSQRLGRMLSFLDAVSYADNSLALFNDSANASSLKPGEILEAGRGLGVSPCRGRSWAFPATGYFGVSSADAQDRLIVDCGPPSVHYNAAHAHCDLLSYELQIDGKPFIVDSAVHGYGGDRFREYSRSTRAHNTVMIGGSEQSEVWSTFRMGAMASGIEAETFVAGDQWNFRGSYRPYFDHGIIHKRSISYSSSGEWKFEDTVKGTNAAIDSFIHFHPECKISKTSESSFECRLGKSRLEIKTFRIEQTTIVSGSMTPTQGWYFPEFGIARPAPTLCLRSTPQSGTPFGYLIRKLA